MRTLLNLFTDFSGFAHLAEINSQGTLLGSTHNFSLVILSVFIATIASYTALELAGRVAVTNGRTSLLWMTGAAIALGLGIWSMHFVGMLAYQLPIAMSYDAKIVFLSMILTILASAAALYIASLEQMGKFKLLAGTFLMGFGVLGMHYIGMAAMRLEAIANYNPALVALSVLIAFMASGLGLWLAFNMTVEATSTLR